MPTKPAAPAEAPEAEAQPTTAVAVANPQVAAFRQVEAQLRARQDQLLAVLPAKIGVDRFMRVALGAMSRQPKLFDCTTESLVKSMLDAAELGLEPTGLMGQAYLVPFRNKVKDAAGREHWQSEAQLIVGYRGLAELARRSGEVAQVEARAVRERDQFSVEYGTQPIIHHTPYMPGLMGAPASGAEGAPADGAGPFLAFYAVLVFRDGSRFIDVMSVAEVDAIRRRSKSGDSGPWVTDYAEMGRKTVLKRALKYAPVSVVDSRVAEALEAEDRREYGAIVTRAASPAIVGHAARQLAAHARGQVEDVADVGAAEQPDPADPPTAPTPPQDAPGRPAAPAAGPSVSPPAAPAPGPVPGQVTAFVDPAEIPTGPMVACDNLSPYGDGQFCVMQRGHTGPHRGQDGTW